MKRHLLGSLLSFRKPFYTVVDCADVSLELSGLRVDQFLCLYKCFAFRQAKTRGQYMFTKFYIQQ